MSNFGVPFKLSPQDMGVPDTTAAMATGQQLPMNAINTNILGTEAQYLAPQLQAQTNLATTQANALLPQVLAQMASSPAMLVAGMAHPELAVQWMDAQKNALQRLMGGSGQIFSPANSLTASQPALSAPPVNTPNVNPNYSNQSDLQKFWEWGRYFLGGKKPDTSNDSSASYQNTSLNNNVSSNLSGASKVLANTAQWPSFGSKQEMNKWFSGQPITVQNAYREYLTQQKGNK